MYGGRNVSMIYHYNVEWNTECEVDLVMGLVCKSNNVHEKSADMRGEKGPNRVRTGDLSICSRLLYH